MHNVLNDIIHPYLVNEGLFLYHQFNRIGHINKKVFEYKMNGNEIPEHFQIFLNTKIVSEARKKWQFKSYKFTNIKIRKYPTGSFYERHIDFHKPQDSKIYLSFSITLNNDFTGGEFVLENDEVKKAKFNLKKGQGILFEATDYHQVLPVTKGERFSFIGHFIAERS